MHVYIKLRPEADSLALPIHYNYLIQSAVYAALPEDMATHLHDKGYAVEKRKFKLYSFSRLLGKFYIDKNAGTITFPEGATLVMSSPDVRIFTALVNNLLTNNYIRFQKTLWHVEEVRFERQLVEQDTLVVRTLSPVVTYSTLLRPEGGKYTCYYQPGEKEFTNHIGNNLRKKYEAFYNKQPPDGEIAVRALERPYLNVTKFKETIIKGYSCRLRLDGPHELLQIGLDAGLGGKGSQGYGCVEKIAMQSSAEKN